VTFRPDAPCDRRSGFHPGRRFALTGACAIALFAGLALPASGLADGTPLIDATVYSASGSREQIVDTGDLAGCATVPPNGIYDEYLPGGGFIPDPVGGNSWWDLRTALTCGSQPVLPLPLNFGDITVFNNGAPEGQPGSELTPGDLADPSDFVDPDQQPLVSVPSSSQVEYDRPYRGGDDANAEDRVGPAAGAPIQISVFTNALAVTVIPSTTQIAPGQTVTFHTAVTPSPGGNVSYQWNFSDGTPNTSTSPDPTITFDDAGDWPVSVQVSDDQGDGGPGSTLVQVGTPPPGTTTGPTTGAFTTSTPSTSATTPAPPTHHHHHGHAPATSTDTSTTRTSSTTTTSASQTTTTSTTTGTSAATTTTTSTTSTVAGPPAASGSGSAGAAPPLATTPAATTPTGSTPGTTSAPAAPTTTTPAPAPHPGSRLPIVTGRLIASVDPQAPGASPLVHTIAGGIPAAGAIARDRSKNSPAAIIAGILAALVLLGLGAARERQGASAWRSLRPPWSRRS
jgi:hypothetical protein